MDLNKNEGSSNTTDNTAPKEETKSTNPAPETISIVTAAAAEDRKQDRNHFLQGIALVILGIAMATVTVFVEGNKDFHEFMMTGAWVSAFIGGMIILFGRD